MCLSELHNFRLKSKIGYKVICKPEKNSELYPLVFVNKKPLQMGVWLDENDYREDNECSKISMAGMYEYPAGFHIFVFPDVAINYLKRHKKHYSRYSFYCKNGGYFIVYKVRFDLVTARGNDYDFKRVVVAKKMKLLREYYKEKISINF